MAQPTASLVHVTESVSAADRREEVGLVLL